MTTTTVPQDAYRTVVVVDGVELRRKATSGPRGGRRYLYQATASDPCWGYWYESARQAARESDATDRVVQL